jgi:hypothetical protein
VLDIHAGTALSRRLRHGLPNAVNVIKPDLRVVRYQYDAAQSAFVESLLLWQTPPDYHLHKI